MADLSTTIEENATGPKKASNDGGSVEQHSIADQIAADKYCASKTASRGKLAGMRLMKINQGSTVS